MIEKAVLQYSKKRRTNLAMAWLDHKKAYDSVPHFWMMEALEMVGVTETSI